MQFRVLKLFFIYFAIGILIPGLTAVVYKSRYIDQYNDYILGPGLFLIFVIFVPFFLIEFISLRRLKLNSGFKIDDKVALAITGLFVITSILLMDSYDIASRQTGRLTDSGGIGVLNYILKIFSCFYVFYIFIHALNFKDVYGKFKKYSILLIIIGFATSISGSYDIFFIMISVVLLVKPRHINKIFLGGLNWIYLLIGGFSLIIAALVGVINKIGFERLGELLDENYWYFYLDFFAERYIINSVILMISSEKYLFDFNFQMDVVGSYLFGIVDKIMGAFVSTESKGELIYGVNRLVYFDVFANANDLTRTGASPGLFGSIPYFPFFPLNILLFSYYAAFVFSKIDSIISRKIYTISLSGAILFVPFLSLLFESPINFLKFTDAGLLYFLLFSIVKFDKD